MPINEFLSSKSLLIPSKVFLLGEYIALVGRPAIVAGVEPTFRVRLASSSPNADSTISGFSELRCHPDSPAGRLAHDRFELPEGTLVWLDPHQGAGGFGGSTAEYLAVQWAGCQVEDRPLPTWVEVFRDYRNLAAQGKLPPSGVDLVAQMLGGIHVIDGTHAEVSPIYAKGAKLCLLFSASHLPGRKVKTHEHLDQIAESWNPQALVPLLEVPFKEALRALGQSGFGGFAPFVSEYADILWNSGLESPAAHSDREALEALPRVAGVKGTGALLSDAVLVFMDELHAPEDRKRVIEQAEALGLRLVLDGLKPVRGPWFEPSSGIH